jgi:hypothetical protein
VRSRASLLKGLVGVGQGFSVNAGKLHAGSEQVSGLEGRCEVNAGDAADTLAGMADSAGHAGLASALSRATGQGVKTFFAVGVAYGHVSSSLAASAANYSSTVTARTT